MLCVFYHNKKNVMKTFQFLLSLTSQGNFALLPTLLLLWHLLIPRLPGLKVPIILLSSPNPRLSSSSSLLFMLLFLRTQLSPLSSAYSERVPWEISHDPMTALPLPSVSSAQSPLGALDLYLKLSLGPPTRLFIQHLKSTRSQTELSFPLTSSKSAHPPVFYPFYSLPVLPWEGSWSSS